MENKKGVLDTIIEKGFKLGFAGAAVAVAYLGVKYAVYAIVEIKDDIKAYRDAKKVAEDIDDEEETDA